MPRPKAEGDGLLSAFAPTIRRILRLLIGGAWIFHGLYSKLLDGVPRHRSIVGRVLGEDVAANATLAIGVGEVLLGLWVLSMRAPRLCAAVQTVLLVMMNSLEIAFARDLLISPAGMVFLNLLLIASAWWIALPPAFLTRFRRRLAKRM